MQQDRFEPTVRVMQISTEQICQTVRLFYSKYKHQLVE
jgi:hypothetical protein